MPVVSTSGFPVAADALSLVRSLLNDLDIPNRSSITATGASRTANITTITTMAAHNLVPGDTVTVAAVADSSFDGTFVVLTAPTSVTFTYQNTAANASSGNGYVDFLGAGDVFTDSVLLPFLNAAYRKVQRRLQNTSSPSSMGQEDLIGVPAGTTILDDSSIVQLPPDFIAPKELRERVTGVDQFYVPMKQVVNELSERTQGTYNREWLWRDDSIYLVGSTVDIDIRVRYFQSLNSLTDGFSVIQIRDGLDPVAFWTAFLAASSRAAMFSQQALLTLQGQFEDSMREVLTTQAHSRQWHSTRRRPYGGRSFGLWR